MVWTRSAHLSHWIDQGEIAGFQWLGFHEDLPDGCADIATFTRRTPALRGAGRALFEETVKTACGFGVLSINATVRADNILGLSYYEKIGFRDFCVAYGVPLRDGTPVNRISKRYEIKEAEQC